MNVVDSMFYCRYAVNLVKVVSDNSQCSTLALKE